MNFASLSARFLLGSYAGKRMLWYEGGAVVLLASGVGMSARIEAR